MASTQKYLNHLLQHVGITPACSEEERTAAELIASIFRNHGFEPQIQEFSASAMPRLVQAGLGIALFIGVILMGIGGALGVLGFLITIAVTVVFILERTGRPVLSQLGRGGLSQNVIAYHKASGPMASPRNRPVVVVAHYDSPRADLLSQEPFAPYRPLLVKILPYAMVAPAVVAVVNLLPLPGAFKIVLWLLSLVASLVPLAYAAAILANRFVLPYTSGSVCNKSSVASLLGVMDAVAPFEGEDEFPGDIPFEEYMAEQAAFAVAAASDDAASDAEDADADALEVAPEEGEDPAPAALSTPAETQSMDAGDLEASLTPDGTDPAPEGAPAPVPADSTSAFPAQEEGDQEGAADAPVVEDASDEPPLNAEGNLRYGADVIRSLGMVSPACKIEYEEEPTSDPFNTPAPAAVEVQPSDDDLVDEGPAEQPITADGDLAVPDTIADLASVPSEGDDPVDDLLPAEDALEADSDVELDQTMAEMPVAGAFEDQDDIAVADSAPSDQEAAEDSTQVFAMPAPDDAPADEDASAPGSTQVYRPVETVDSLMAQIDANVPSHAQRAPRQIPPVVPDASALQGRGTGNRASLFDVPDPSATPNDPFSAPVESPASKGFTVIGPNDPIPTTPAVEEHHPVAEDAPAPAPAKAAEPADEEGPLHGLARFFGRKKKKKQQDSISDWLGVDDGFDAKKNGGEIGSWDNFSPDDDSWKGGATGSQDATDEELRDAITSLGDDELLGHDIWFVATGSSEAGNAGIKAFLETHRDKLRGVFLINLESIGAGSVSMVSREGETRVLKGDRRIMNLVGRVSQDFHRSFGTVELPFMDTDAHAAMEKSLRSLTIAGVDSAHLACSHSEEDQPYNVDAENVQVVADVVTEVIRRS